MVIQRKNAKGGRKLSGFPLVKDHDTLGYKLGYCGGCNEPIVIRLSDVTSVVDEFGYSYAERDRGLITQLGHALQKLF